MLVVQTAWKSRMTLYVQGIRGEEKVSSEVDVSELVNFVLRDSGMHVNIAIGIAYVSVLTF